MKNTDKKIEISYNDMLFLIAWILFIVSTVLELSMWASNSNQVMLILKMVRYGAYLLCAINIISGMYERRLMAGLLLALAILGIGVIGSTNKTMFLYAFLFFAAYGISSKTTICCSFFTRLILLVSIISASLLGIIEDYIFTPEARARHGLGFTWTTTGAVIFFFLMLQYIYIRKKRISFIELLILEIINWLFYQYTDSRMVFAMGSLFLVVVLMAKVFCFKWRFLNLFRKIYVIMPTLICLFALGLHMFYNKNIQLWEKLNSFLSDRLALGKSAVQAYGISFFGKKIEWVGYSVVESNQEYNYVDCSYLQLLLEYGIIFLILVILIYTIIMYHAVKIKDYFLVVIIMFVLCISITEPRLMNLTFNPFPVLILCSLDLKRTTMWRM